MEGGGGGGNSSCLMSFGDHHGGGNSGGGGGGLASMMMMHPHQNNNNLFLPLPSTITNHQNNNNNNSSNNTACYFSDQQQNDGSNNISIRAKIIAHPLYPKLLTAYVNCQKVGAPQEVVTWLEEACASEVSMGGRGSAGSLGEDPSLDQFMEAYCEMLTKYEQELTKPFKEAMLFLSRIECQFKALTVGSSDSGLGPWTCNSIHHSSHQPS